MTEEFIELIRKHEILYNTNLPGYRDLAIRNTAWEEIAKLQKSTVDECKDKWTKLRNCFTNAIKRRAKKSGQGGKSLTPWRLETQMSFLIPFLEGKEASTYVAMSSIDSPSQDFVEDIDSANDDSNQEYIMFPTQEPSPLHNSTPMVTIAQKMKRKQIYESDPFSNENVDTNPLQDHRIYNQMDDMDMFMLSMSSILRKLPKIDQAQIRMNLHKEIHEAEMKLLVKNHKGYSSSSD